MNDLLLRSTALRQMEALHVDAQPPLMERAGLAAAGHACALLSQKIHADGYVLILAGPGNNGGDAYVCARHLALRSHAVRVISLAPDAALPPDAEAARSVWLAAGGRIESDWPADENNIDLLVDGLFGIGLTRTPTGRAAEWIARANTQPCPRLALDIPSGLDADTGAVHGIALKATHTLTFLAAKPGLYTLDGPDHCGEIVCAPLDVPAPASTASDTGIRLHAPVQFAKICTPRQRNSHKGSYGSVAILGGAPGMTGAPLLAGRAALHLGAGRVFVGLLEPLAVDFAQPELMLRTPEDALSAADVIGIGPGLGQSAAALTLLKAALATDKPLALDADALNLLATHPALLKPLSRRSAPTVLTPHPAEAARLLACSTDEIQADRIAAACRLAAHSNSIVVLKGCGTVIATPDGHWCINTSGNPGLATAGSGDVLLGMLCAILHNKQDATQVFRATCATVHLHGAAADLCVEEGRGPIGLTAGELVTAARQLWNRWAEECN